jgi:hypothetical protein
VAEENLKQVYEDPFGVRGRTRQAVTDNQRTVLWAVYVMQTYKSEPTSDYALLRPKARARALAGLQRKGFVDADGKVTAKGVSYATRLRK